MSFPAASYLDEPKSTKRCEQLLLCAGVTCVKPMTIFINLYIYILKIQIYVYNYIFTDYHCIAMLKVHRAHICAPLRILTLKATLLIELRKENPEQPGKTWNLLSHCKAPGNPISFLLWNLLWTSTLSVHFLQPVQNLLGFSCSIPNPPAHCPAPLSQCCCLCFSLGIPESRPLSA